MGRPRKKTAVEVEAARRKRATERSRVLRTKFGMTTGEYQRILDRQSGKCAICRKPPAMQRRLAIDHCHKTGRVRGLLCTRCNVGLGYFDDDVDLVFYAYLHLRDS